MCSVFTVNLVKKADDCWPLGPLRITHSATVIAFLELCTTANKPTCNVRRIEAWRGSLV